MSQILIYMESCSLKQFTNIYYLNMQTHRVERGQNKFSKNMVLLSGSLLSITYCSYLILNLAVFWSKNRNSQRSHLIWRKIYKDSVSHAISYDQNMKEIISCLIYLLLRSLNVWFTIILKIHNFSWFTFRIWDFLVFFFIVCEKIH